MTVRKNESGGARTGGDPGGETWAIVIVFLFMTMKWLLPIAIFAAAAVALAYFVLP